MIRSVLRSSMSRMVSVVLVAGQVLVSVPAAAQSPAPSPPATPTPPASTPPPAAPTVTINRTVPTVTAPPSEPQFSASPTVQEIFRARVFREPIVPVGGAPTPGETLVLARALLAFHRGGGTAWRNTLGEFLRTHPESPWRASLLAQVATLQLREHGYSRALESWNEAWTLAKDGTDIYSRAVADGAVAEWLTLAASFGQIEQVETRLAEVIDRPIGGSAGPKVAAAREAIALIKGHPERTLPCGSEALLALLTERGAPPPAFLSGYRATAAGTSLGELEGLAARAGLSLRMAFRGGATEIPVPAILHLKVGHFVAVAERQGDRYRVIDRTRADSSWVSRDTLLDESSGYVLIDSTLSPEGWRAVSETESHEVRGRGPLCPDGSPPPPPPPNCDCKGDKCCDRGRGMATYALQSVTASLLITDTPLGYTPPRGPAVPLSVRYHHRDSLQPQIFTSSNVGPKWSFSWVRFVQEVPTDALGVTPPHVWVALPPGREVFSNPDAQGVYPAHWDSRAVLVRVSTAPVRYERRLPDGTVEIYALSDGAPAGQRRVLMTGLIDPLGQALTFTWDSQARLVAITDAIGQVTTLAYAHATDPLKITTITDPFGRFATFTYNPGGQLASITDILGLTSAFAYGPNDFVSSLTTPYGTTVFRHEPTTNPNMRFIEATDPLGGTEHLEFQWETPALAATAPASEVPTGFTGWNANLDHYNTFYWSPRAWMLGRGDITKAEIIHWLVKAEWQGWQKYSYVPHSVKKPLEGRVWYAYPGQTAGNEDELGWWRMPSRVGRVLDDGTSQIFDATYNTQGSVLTKTDPLGRQTSYTYGTNGVDLLEVRQTTGGMNDLLASYSTFNGLHLPQTTTDAAGQTTTMTYNAAGQLLTATNAKSETTTNVYDATGRLTSVSGPVSGATTTYTYDAYGRLRTTTDADGYTVTLDSDLFDRSVRVSYPDGTYEETTYDRLDVATRRDRAGRITRSSYDVLRRLMATRDPAGRVVAQEWCTCGSLEALVDANGNRTRWERDLQGRVTREVRADGTTATVYVYEPLRGRLKTLTDPKAQVTTYTYVADDAVASTVYTNAAIATPSVSFTYETAYGRFATMTDGIGMTAYAYHPVGVLGAGQVASVDGPLTNDTITYAYDELGRVTTRAINSVGVTWAFDALRRTTSEANVLGTFTYTYEGPTSRVATVAYPNGQTSGYTYFGNTVDRRLQTIHHKYPNGTTLSRFDYTYDAVGNIVTWQQQGGTAALWSYGYDAANQLTSAVTTDAAQAVLKRYAYTYDPAGNRTVEQIDDQVVGATYTSLNRLLSQQSAGPMRFAGSVNEPATVTVQSVPATVTAQNQFAATAPVAPGTNVVTVSATDSSGNTATRQYEVDSTAAGRTFTYDANGNLTADGTRTFEWDARNQLVAVNVGTHRSEFTYDGLQRRVRVVEKENSVVQTDTKVIWCQTMICEERAADGVTVTRRAFTRGEQVTGTSRYFATDHLGSVTEVTDGAVTALARYAFDPWGSRTLTAGTDSTSVGYTGHRWQSSALGWLTQYRFLDPAMGRWATEDPLGLEDGPNLYAYVTNNPLRSRDPDGRTAAAAAAGVGICTAATAGACGAAAAAATAATAMVLCIASPECRKQVGCFAEYLKNVSYCTGRGLATPDEATLMRCWSRAWLRYQACRRNLCDTDPPPLWDPPPPSGPPSGGPPGPPPPPPQPRKAA